MVNDADPSFWLGIVIVTWLVILTVLLVKGRGRH